MAGEKKLGLMMTHPQIGPHGRGLQNSAGLATAQHCMQLEDAELLVRRL